MPVRVLFRCEFCGAGPDEETQKGLEAQLQELYFGTYFDIEPGNWLIWHGGGLMGPARYACGQHRGELKAKLREHYGTIGHHPWAMGPHPVRFHRRGRVKVRNKIGPGWASGWGPTA
ncbi:MAG: hypothetical protein M3M99_06065 [Actinomycetota bacterium]|nr:hypothetical protein [Actinomycetota bacterium]